MKKMFIIVLIFIGVLFLNGCTGMSRYNVRIVDENYKIKEEFLNNNKTFGSYDETTQSYINDRNVPEEYTYVVNTEQELNNIFSEFPKIDFNKEMVIVYVYTSIYNEDRKIIDVDIDEGELSIDFKYKLKPFSGSAVNPYQKTLIIIMDRVMARSVDVDLDD